MSRSHGTGQPAYFACAACRRRPEWRVARRVAVYRTGKTRPYKGSNGGARVLREHHEYVCGTCGHRGWTRHKDILRKKILTRTDGRMHAKRCGDDECPGCDG